MFVGNSWESESCHAFVYSPCVLIPTMVSQTHGLRSLRPGIYWYSCLIWFRFVFVLFFFSSISIFIRLLCLYICGCACVCLPFATIFCFFLEPLSSIYNKREWIYVRVLYRAHYNYSALIISYKLCAHTMLACYNDSIGESVVCMFG